MRKFCCVASFLNGSCLFLAKIAIAAGFLKKGRLKLYMLDMLGRRRGGARNLFLVNGVRAQPRWALAPQQPPAGRRPRGENSM